MGPQRPAPTMDGPGMTRDGRGDKALPGNDHLYEGKECGEITTTGTVVEIYNGLNDTNLVEIEVENEAVVFDITTGEKYKIL